VVVLLLLMLNFQQAKVLVAAVVAPVVRMLLR
jgi:hypothetical protein